MIRNVKSPTDVSKTRKTRPARKGESSRRESPARMTRRALLIGGAGVMIGGAVLSQGRAAPRARLLSKRWARFGDDAIGPDHVVWTNFLERYRLVDDKGVARLRYDDVSANDKQALKGYLAQLQAVKPADLSKTAAFAYWVNLYNAATVSLVLDAYPVRSIREVHGGFFNSGPWKRQIFKIDDQELSLDDVEHGILRPIYRDPRIHYAVNCAAVGCPNLAARAYASDEFDAMLDRAAKSYVNNWRGVQFHEGDVIVSSIYSWFKEDFGGDEAGVLSHLRKYANAELRTRLEGVTSIESYRYNWRLNDA